MKELRYSKDASIVMVEDEDGNFSCPSQEEMDELPVGEDLTEEEVENLEE